MISIFPIAEASVTTLMNSINRVIIGPLIMFLFALAVIYFMYGLFQYLISPDNEEIKKTSKKHMFWGIFGMFIMVAVFIVLSFIKGRISFFAAKTFLNRKSRYSIISNSTGSGAILYL